MVIDMGTLITRSKRRIVPYTYQEDKLISQGIQQNQSVDDIVTLLQRNNYTRTKSAIKHRLELYKQLEMNGVSLEVYYGVIE